MGIGKLPLHRVEPVAQRVHPGPFGAGSCLYPIGTGLGISAEARCLVRQGDRCIGPGPFGADGRLRLFGTGGCAIGIGLDVGHDDDAK